MNIFGRFHRENTIFDTTKERKSTKTRVTSIGGSIKCRERTCARGAKLQDAEKKEELAQSLINFHFGFVQTKRNNCYLLWF